MATSENDLSSRSEEPAPVVDSSLSRRKFIGGVGGAAAAMAIGSVGLDPLVNPASQASAEIGSQIGAARRRACDKYRRNTSEFHLRQTVASHPDNGDEARYGKKLGSYSKCLPHNSFGEVDPTAYRSMIHAATTGNPDDYENIIIDGSNHPVIGKLNNPQCGLAFDLQGADSHALVEPPAPGIASAECAGEMVEHYWMSLLRDVNFDQYDNDSLAAEAVADIDGLSNFRGLKAGGHVTRATLFRDPFPGCGVGPYISQFMYLNTPFGTENIDRRQRTYLPGIDHMQRYSDWLNAQNGGVPNETQAFDTTRLFIRNGRDLAAWVHVDVLFQAYFNACLIMLTPPSSDPLSAGLGVPLNPGNPYRSSRTQFAFGTFGAPAIKALMCEVASRALKHQWFQKWFVHRRLHPEAFAGLVHHQLKSNRYNGILHNDVLNSAAMPRIKAHNGATWLLPMAFPEGSPTHPAYASGHATVAGACVTILKALFDENFVIPNPKVPTPDGLELEPFIGPPLTIRGELNKVASNIATGRNHAGVHWRSDAIEGMLLGEQVALHILRDQRDGYNEFFGGYTFTRFNGAVVTV